MHLFRPKQARLAGISGYLLHIEIFKSHDSVTVMLSVKSVSLPVVNLSVILCPIGLSSFMGLVSFTAVVSNTGWYHL